MENYIVDLVVISIVLFCAYIGHKNGILSGILTLVSGIISFIGANICVPYISPYVGKAINPFISKFVEASPEKYIQKFIPMDSLSEFSQLALDKSLDVIDLLIRELTVLTQDIIAFFIIFVIMIIISNKLLRFLSLNLPLLKTVNRFLGLCFGGFVGVVLVIILFSAVTKYIEADSTYISLLPYFKESFFARFFLSNL